MVDNNENAPIFYPDLGELAPPEPGKAEGLTLKPYEYTKSTKRKEDEEVHNSR